MSISSYQLNIRTASLDELDIIGKVHASAFSDNQMYGVLFKDVDPDVWQRWIWDTAAKGVEEGHGAVLILERSDTKEIIGVAWFHQVQQSSSTQASRMSAGRL